MYNNAEKKRVIAAFYDISAHSREEGLRI